MRRWLVPLVAAVTTTSFAGEPDSRLGEGVSAYDAGRYAEACMVFRELDARGTLDGPSLYRLFFCSNVTGDSAAARAALERAATALESENVPGCSVEVPFYLANAYANLGRPTDARRVADDTLARLDADAFRPATAMEWFQIGKLAQDAGRTDRALLAYGRAVSGFSEGPEAPGHERWARRFLGVNAFDRGDYGSAAAHWRRVVELGNPERADLLALATSAARAGEWEGAAEAWRRAEKIDMAQGDDPRYAAALARQAVQLGGLPPTDPAGKPWTSYDRTELETFLTESATAARAVRADAFARESGGTWNAEEREKAVGRLRDVRRGFVAAGIEYAIRGLPLRETAFTGQYAPLVFQDTEWTLPDVGAAPVKSGP